MKKPCEKVNPYLWQYESDGDQYTRTYYLHRYNDKTPLGIERIDFKSKKKALEQLETLQKEGQ